jgi:hypothetical protein
MKQSKFVGALLPTIPEYLPIIERSRRKYNLPEISLDDEPGQYLETAPWSWFFPGTLILLTVLGINFVGDGLRDAFDPHNSRHL